MNYFYLPKGTEVKHGTSLIRAEEIIFNGFNTNKELRCDVREKHEIAPESQGVYVGELISYFAAYTAYSSELVDMYLSLNPNEFLNYFYTSPKKLLELNLNYVPSTLPVVLNIELGEDSILIADEDFVADGSYPANIRVPDDILVNEAETTWLKWKTGCILTEIKKEWIKEIEYPCLSNFGSISPTKNTWLDCELFARGLLQSYHKEPPTPLIDSFIKQNGRFSLTNKVPATRKGIEKILKSKKFIGKGNQLFNHISFGQILEEMCQRYDIPLINAA